jgi:dipeptide/tripeptide permease
MMMVGTLFYLVGFTMYGFVSAYWLFLVAILLITIGEMVVMPVGQALVARFAPEDMRGRYMAMFGLAAGFYFLHVRTRGRLVSDTVETQRASMMP